MTTPLITVFVRHTAGCKYAGDEFAKRCACRKHLRWTANGKQHRRQAGTRSWTEAEAVKRNLEDQLLGKPAPTGEARSIREAAEVFIQDKRVQGVTEDVIAKYARELSRLGDHCERLGVYTVQGITRELLTGFCATWERLYPSTQTRVAVRSRCRGFLRYGYEAQWLERIPAMPKIQSVEPETLPLTDAEYDRLLKSVVVFTDPERRQRVHALVQLMRWSGLAVRDALTLAKEAIQHDAAQGIYRVRMNRQKTGTHVSVPIPPDVAEDLLAVVNDGPYVFWDGESDIVKTWTKYYIAPAFKAAKITSDGYMVSHRLRDTFAVDLLSKGVPMEEVSRLLGHTSIRTTEKSYAKWSKSRQDRVDSLVSASWPTPKMRRERVI